MSEVTKLIEAANRGDRHAASELLPLVYDELRKLAAAKLEHEKSGQTLDATALVHEAYLRLVGGQQFTGRGHFFAAAAEAMRRLLVDSARRKQTEKHGGGLRREHLDGIEVPGPEASEDLLALDEALSRFESIYPDKAAIVKLRYFAGLTLQQIAEAQEVSLATVNRAWAFARAWLHQQVSGPKKF